MNQTVRKTSVAALAVTAMMMLGTPGIAQHQRPPVPPDRLPQAPGLFAPVPGEVGVLPVQGNVYMLNLADVNIVAQVGEDGILLVDTGPAEWSDRIIRTLRDRFGMKPIIYIINTHLHPDHVGGNAAIIKAANYNNPRVIAHENTYNRLLGVVDGEEEHPEEALPNSTFFTRKKMIYFNGEPIEILFQPSAHTDGDVMVWFRSSDVLAVGDVFSTTTYPVLDEKRGSTIQGHLNALNQILDITVPGFNMMNGTRVIPGHGRLCNIADVNSYRNYMTIVRDRVRDMVATGMTLAQVKAAHPTLEYDGLYEDPEWTPEMFLEAVYRDLSQAAQATRAN